MNSYAIRTAEPRDVASIVELVTELAEFEQLSHLLALTADKLTPFLFGPKPVIEALVGEVKLEGNSEAQVVAYALFFTNFSTFLAKPGLYLEDLYVREAHRGGGLGKGLLSRMAEIANERDYGRFEWSVLDWNENAIRFYESMGAAVMPEWRICRLSGDALSAYKA